MTQDAAPPAIGEERVAGRFHVRLDLATMQSEVTALPAREGAAQPPQALMYDLDIVQFQKPSTFRIVGMEIDEGEDIVLTWRHAHPFPAPDITLPISGINRADLGYTGRAVIIGGNTPTPFFDGAVTVDPLILSNPDGYLPWSDVLPSHPDYTAYPYTLLANELFDNRTNVSNGGSPTGSYDAPGGGWQRGNLGPDGLGWTGYDFVHQGQETEHYFRLHSGQDAFLEFDVALLIKYTDPRGVGGRNLRLPPETVDVTQFAYRLPYAALDCSVVGGAGFLQLGAGGATLGVTVRDWDAGAAPGADADLSDESDVSLVQPGGNGVPQVDFDAPDLDPDPFALAGISGTGLPGNEMLFEGAIVDTLGTASGGDKWGLVRVIDDESLLDDSAYHFGVDPQTLDPTRQRTPKITYQVFRYIVVKPPVISAVLLPPEIYPGQSFQLALEPTENDFFEYSWYFGGDEISPRTSAEAFPSVTVGDLGYYPCAVTVRNSGGTSAPFAFELVVSPPVAPPATLNPHVMGDPPGARGMDLTLMTSGFALSYLEQGSSNLMFARSNGANPASAADWVTMELVPATGSTGRTAVCSYDGRLAVAYDLPVTEKLYLAYTEDARPNSVADWFFAEVDDTGTRTAAPAMTEANGLLHIAFVRSFDPPGVRMATALVPNPAGPADFRRIYTDPTARDGNAPSIASLDGRVGIAFQEFPLPRLIVTTAISPFPQTHADFVPVEVDGSFTGGLPDLEPALGSWGVLHQSTSPFALKFSRSNDGHPASGVDWTTHTMIAGNYRTWSLAVAGNRYVAAHSISPAGNLMFSRALTINPLAGGDWATQELTAAGVNAGEVKLATNIDSSWIAPVYHDAGSSNIGFFRTFGGWWW